jgi:hypothetical protein
MVDTTNHIYILYYIHLDDEIMGYDYKSMGNEPWISGWWFGT